MLDLDGVEKRNTRNTKLIMFVVNYYWLLHKRQLELRINMLVFGVQVSSSGQASHSNHAHYSQHACDDGQI